MMPHHVYSQLAILGLLWLCVILHSLWPSRGSWSPQAPAEPLLTKDTAGEVMGRARIYPHAPARAAKGERRVGARGVSTNQAATRTRLIAIAMRRCCRWVFASPI